MPAEPVKICSRCAMSKPISAFYRSKLGKDGLRADCKACVSAIKTGRDKEKAAHNSRNTNYGLLPDGYYRLVYKYQGLCHLCQVRDGADIDHCHATGRVRGYLCHRCNLGLGQFKDDTALFHSALSYLGGIPDVNS